MKTARILFLLALLLAACGGGGASFTPTPAGDDPRDEFYNEITATAALEATQLALPTLSPSTGEVLSRTENVVLYQYYNNQTQEGDFCLWSQANGYVLLAPMTEQVTVFSNALISPDEATLIYAPYFNDQNHAELWKINVDGTQAQQLLTVDDLLALRGDYARAMPLQMLWLPGTAQIIFNTSEFTYKGRHLNDLHLLDTATGELTTIAPQGQGGFFALSPDGTALALVRPEGADAYLVNGWQKRAQVVYPPTVGLSSEDVYPSAAWRTDGSAFHLAVPELGDGSQDGQLIFYRVALDGRPAEEVLRLDTGFRPPTRPVYFSPDGDWAVYEAQYAQTMVASEIHLVKLDGSAHFVFEAEAYFHKWLPDGQSFVYITPSEFVQADLKGNTQPYSPDIVPTATGPAPWMQDCISE